MVRLPAPGRELGQATPLLAVVVLVAGVSVVLVGRLGSIVVDHAAARTAADAAALASAAAGRGAAHAFAERNGARVVDIDERHDGFVVTVANGSAEVTARAARSGGSERRAAPVHRVGLDPRLTAALARARDLLGFDIPITSGYRSRAEQARLYARRHTNFYPVAPPGRSMHERGLAVDVPRTVAERLAAVGSRVGLCRPYPRTDPVHFELCAGPLRNHHVP